MTDWSEAIQAMVAKQEPTPTPPADPYSALREEAEHRRNGYVVGVRGRTILGLLAERDRLGASVSELDVALRTSGERLEQALAALRASEERAADLADALEMLLHDPDHETENRAFAQRMLAAARAALAKEATDG